MTNYDKIRSMTLKEMAKILPCPYDTAGRNIMPCLANDILPNDEMCHKCILEWLKREAESSDDEETLTTSHKAWELIYEKTLRLEAEYYDCKDIENVNRAIKLQNLLQYFKEELTEEE